MGDPTLRDPLLPEQQPQEEEEEERQPHRLAGAGEELHTDDHSQRSEHTLPGDQESSTHLKPNPRPRRLLKLALEHWRWLLLGCVALMVRLPFSIAQPHLVSVGVIGALLHRDAGSLQRSVILFAAAGSVDALLDFWCVFLFSFVKSRLVRRVRLRLFAALLRQESAFFDSARAGDLLSRLTSDTVEMANDLTWVFRFSIEAVVRILGVAGYMFAVSPRLAGLACTAVPIVALGNKFYGNWLHDNARKVQSALAAANAHAAEVVTASRTVFSFASERMEEQRYSGFVQKHYSYSVWQAVADGVYYCVFSTFLMQVVVQAIILVYGSWLVWHEQLDVEELVAFLMYRGQLQEWTGNLLNSFSSLIKSSGAAHEVFVMLERVPNFSPTLGLKPSDPLGLVSFEGVHFAYPTRPDAPVLRGLSFTAEPGEVVALTGPSGAGKSTCFHLLEHLYEPSRGQVMLEGHKVSDLDHCWLHANVGLVGQEPVLFSGSILENILYPLLAREEDLDSVLQQFREQADVPVEVVEAARVANAHGFITSLPDGYHTEIGERGVQLSGGQKQRVAIARAVIQNPRVLLLDEATSSLDAESEALVQAALERVMRSRTTLVIAHRLSTVRRANKILVLSQGRVVESGVHEDLMARPLLEGVVTYRALVQRQHAFLES